MGKFINKEIYINEVLLGKCWKVEGGEKLGRRGVGVMEKRRKRWGRGEEIREKEGKDVGMGEGVWVIGE